MTAAENNYNYDVEINCILRTYPSANIFLVSYKTYLIKLKILTELFYYPLLSATHIPN